ncbi:MAG: hypothetical protein SVT56_07850 [Chloroflexota bacterium]|nr:hypothetical protein [Chloroflexota bacterium]
MINCYTGGVFRARFLWFVSLSRYNDKFVGNEFGQPKGCPEGEGQGRPSSDEPEARWRVSAFKIKLARRAVI